MRKKRPRDPLQLAKLIDDIATGQVEDRVGVTHQSNWRRPILQVPQRDRLPGTRELSSRPSGLASMQFM